MVECSGGGRVAVYVKGKPSKEYDIEVKREGDVKTYTCYIEAKEGQEYEVRLTCFAFVERGKICARVCVDGERVEAQCQCTPEGRAGDWQHEGIDMTFLGFHGPRSEDGEVYNSFAFHKILTTAEGEAPKLTYEELDTACSIRVEMSFWKRSHEHRDHRGYRRTVQKLPVVTTYHEDTKPAQWGICTGVGQRKRRSHSKACYCKVVEMEEKIVVLFKYRPHQWLVGKGLKHVAQFEEDEDDSDFEIDWERTEESARELAKKKAREGVEDQLRRVRVKTEKE